MNQPVAVVTVLSVNPCGAVLRLTCKGGEYDYWIKTGDHLVINVNEDTDDMVSAAGHIYDALMERLRSRLQ